MTASNNNAFVFESYDFRDETGELRLRYSYENGPAFEEKIVFPPASRPLSPSERAALEASFCLIFLLSGISYYKAYAPQRLICRAFPLDEATAAFVEKVYRHGLAEFAYRNNVDLGDRIKFEDVIPAKAGIPFGLQNNEIKRDASLRWHDNDKVYPARVLVPIGGGKDSIVTLECLKQAGETLTLFALGGASGLAEPIRATIEVSGLPSLRVERTLSPNLMELNRSGAFNGHIPITAILSSLTVASAILHSFSAIVMSNEHSASEPNLRLGSWEINHQYSKSFAFETDLARFVKDHISPDLAYFSFLRPLTETAIARRFAGLEKYHGVFRSCNAAFRQDAERRNKNWCCDCPKCRFIFLALAPFMDKAKLVGLFGKNLLADESQQEGFAELCGVASHKPFECVGEVEESALLMEKLSRQDNWKDEAVVHALGSKLCGKIEKTDEKFNALFAMKTDHQMPDKFLEILRACN